MTSRGYTVLSRVGLALGRDLSGSELGQYEPVAEAAELWVDAYTGRTWLAGPIVAERLPVENGHVWLKHKPVTAVSAVRRVAPFTTATTLAVATDYELDATRGLLRILTWASVGEVEVDYTVPQTVPADVSQATTELIACWLAIPPGGPAGLYKSISIDGQRLDYRDQADLGAVPGTVERLLGRYVRPVLA